MSVLFRCEGLHKRYGAVHALRGAGLTVEEGTIHGLVGHNGAGKSTLVKIVVGLTGWDAGSIEFAGERLTEASRHGAVERGIWMAPQELTVLPDLSVADNVCVGDEPRRGPWVSRRAMRKRAVDALARLGLDLDPDARVDELRPSEQRMVMIAMAVSRDCRMVILDEPTASLGTDEAEPLLELIESLPSRGITVLYISHRLDEVERLCDRVTVMRDGITLASFARGEFDAAALIARMVDEMPDRPARTGRARGQQPSIRMAGVHGKTLRGVDVDIHPGVITGFTGLVGSGADELLDILVGRARPAAGTVELDGRELALSSPADALQAGIGFVPGSRGEAAMRDLTIRENLLASSMGRVSGPAGLLVGGAERQRARRFASRFGLEARVERPLADLSGGNQQKILLARLRSAEADVLVVNDPTAGVDVKARADLHELLREAADEGRTVVVRCSEPEELLDLADDIYVLAGGRIAGRYAGEGLDLARLLATSASSGVAQTASRKPTEDSRS
jgi:ABC-type sugar transport system ATPase subunit